MCDITLFRFRIARVNTEGVTRWEINYILKMSYDGRYDRILRNILLKELSMLSETKGKRRLRW